MDCPKVTQKMRVIAATDDLASRNCGESTPSGGGNYRLRELQESLQKPGRPNTLALLRLQSLPAF